MGYMIYLMEHEFVLKAEHTGEAIERWRKYESEKTDKFYSSIFQGEEEGEENIAQLFANIGFEVEVTDEAVTIDGWEGKAWEQDEYIRAISDLAEPGWYLDWEGEDMDRWRIDATDTTTGEVVYVRPNLEYRLRDLTKMLDEYDETPVAQGPELTETVIRELSAVGPIIAAVRALIKDLS